MHLEIKRLVFGSRKRIIVAALLAVALVASATAAAAWLLTATASTAGGQFSSASAPIVNNVAVSGTATTKCSPNSLCDGIFNITNPSSGPLTLTGVSGITGPPSAGFVAGVVGGVNQSACKVELAVSGALGVKNLTGLNITVPAGTSNVIVPGYFAIGNLPDNACSGATFEINDSTASDVGTLQFSG